MYIITIEYQLNVLICTKFNKYTKTNQKYTFV